jgi:hypothetical protein
MDASAEVRERLLDLDDCDVWLSIIRAIGNERGGAVRRGGRLHLCVAASDLRSLGESDPEVKIGEVLDTSGVRLAVLLSSQTMSSLGDSIHVEHRLSLRLDISGTKPPESPHTSLTYAEFVRDLTAEVESAFLEGLVVSPDPDPPARPASTGVCKSVTAIGA